MTKSSQALRLAVIAIATFTSVLRSHSEELLRIAPGIAKSVVVDGAVAGNFTSIVGNPKIADVTFGPKNALWFVGLAEGTTNFIMLDNNTGREIYSTIIVVGDNNLYSNRVNIHNKALLASHTVYRCDPICLYAHEVPDTEAAPLPNGYLKSSATLDQSFISAISRLIKPAGAQ